MHWAFCLLAAISLRVEHARTEEEIRWGLMGRTSLEKDCGMLFHLEEGLHTFWMFNCQIDLDLAFLDAEGKILEIHQLFAHPEVMDPNRPILSFTDLALYPPSDPVRRFFERRAVRSRHMATYALEVPLGWLAEQKIEVGNHLDLSDLEDYDCFNRLHVIP